MIDARCNAIMFHHFTDGVTFPNGEGAITAKQLDRIIVGDGSYKVICASDWLNKFNTNNLRKNEFCLTFDDNLRCQTDIALPVLEKHKLNAFWFVYTAPFCGGLANLELFRWFRLTAYQHNNAFWKDFRECCLEMHGSKITDAIEKFKASSFLKSYKFYSDEDRCFRYIRDLTLSPEEYSGVMRRMMSEKEFKHEKVASLLSFGESDIVKLHKNGHVIGLHSHNHPTNMRALPKNEQESEYHTNFDVLSSILNTNIFSVAHPVNSYSGETLDILSNLGIEVGFRSNPSVNSCHGNLELPRIDHVNITNQVTNKII